MPTSFGVIGPGTAALFHAAAFISVVINSALVTAYKPRVPKEDDAPAERATMKEAA